METAGPWSATRATTGDPITAQGISDAFIDAEMLAAALSATLSGTGGFDDLLAAHEAARNERVRPMFEFTTQLAALEPPPSEMQALFGALRENRGRHQCLSVGDHRGHSAG